jgi:hypothetical protein
MATTRAPTPASIALVLLAAALIGFLLGALVAVTNEQPASSPTSTASPTAQPSATTPSPPTSTATPEVDAELSLSADRDSADTGELIRLTGTLTPPGAGVTLQVQQSVDGIGFTDFPVTATTRSDGSFGIWVRTGRVGRNEFRMVTEVEDQQVASNAVVVETS